VASGPSTQTWSAEQPRSPALHHMAERLGGFEQLDGPAERVSAAVRGALGPGALKDALSGTWLGHALHPLLTDLPIGTWTSANLLDLFGGPGTERAAERLIGVGIATALPTAATGWTDWADTTLTSERVRRIGVVHALANTASLALYGLSWTARKRGHRRRGVALALAGAGALAVGGQLGGHMSYGRGVGVDQTTFEYGPEEWTTALADAALGEGESKSVDVADVTVMVTRQSGRVYALRDRCCHRGGPLHEGAIEDGCVICPWHESAFRLEDGSVARGPATAPQPAYDVRVREGSIEVRVASAA
jgi:nitrite reductase/ring-hydroxylating ferredoxin subunit